MYHKCQTKQLDFPSGEMSKYSSGIFQGNSADLAGHLKTKRECYVVFHGLHELVKSLVKHSYYSETSIS